MKKLYTPSYKSFTSRQEKIKLDALLLAQEKSRLESLLKWLIRNSVCVTKSFKETKSFDLN